MDYINLLANVTSIMVNLVTLWQVRKILLTGAKVLKKDIVGVEDNKTTP